MKGSGLPRWLIISAPPALAITILVTVFLMGIFISNPWLGIREAEATTYNWTGATSTAWATTTNWSPNGNPGSAAGDVVQIGVVAFSGSQPTLSVAPANALASITLGTATNATLTISAAIAVTTGAVTINAGSTWYETAATTPTFTGGIANSGTFTASTGVHTFSTNAQALSGTISIPSVTVTGITATNNGTLTVGTALAGATGTLTNSGTLNIQGTCSIGTTSGGLSNSGTVAVSGSGAITTLLAGFTNTGTINLNGSGTIAGITNNAGGIVNLASSGTVTSFNNATSTSTLNISALTVPTITTLTVSTSGNTVNYSGAGNQIVKDVAYSNLTTSGGSGTKTWTEGAARTMSGNLTIGDGTTLSVGGAYAFTVSGITTIGSGTSGILSITNATGTKTFTLLVTVNSGGQLTNTNSATIIFTGGLNNSGTVNVGNGAVTYGGVGLTNNSSGTFSWGSGNQTFSSGGITNYGSWPWSSQTAAFIFNTSNQAIGGSANISVGTITVNSVTLTNNSAGLYVAAAINGTSGTFTQGNNSFLGLWCDGNSVTITLTATATGNTVYYYNTGGAQTVKAVTYYHLTINKSGYTATLGSGTTTVNGNLTVTSGTLDVAGQSFTVIGSTSVGSASVGTLKHSSGTNPAVYNGTVTINSNGVWNDTSSPNIFLRGGLSNSGTFTAGSGAYTFDAFNKTGLVGYWPFSDNGGSTVSGTDGYGNTGTSYNGTWQGSGTATNWWAPAGMQGVAGQFNGIDDYVQVPNSTALNPGSITIAMWLYLKSDPNCDGNNNWRSILHKGNTSSTTTGYDIVLEEGRSIAWDTGTGSSDRWWPAGVSIPIGRWTHLVLTYDAVSGQKTAYQDGVFKDSKVLASALPLQSNTNDLYINNASTSCPNGAGNFNGLIDEVRIYNRAISTTDITSLYTFDPIFQSISSTNAITIPNMNVGNIVTTPNMTVNGFNLTNNISTGTGLTVSTTLGGNGTIIQGSNAVLSIGGGWGTNSPGIAGTVNANTVSYTGSGQTVKGANYYNLTISQNPSTGTATLANPITVSGTLTVSGGTFDTNSAKNWPVTFNNNGTLADGGTINWNNSTIYITGVPTADVSMAGVNMTGTTSAIYFTRTAYTTKFSSGVTTASLTVNGPGGTLRLDQGTQLTHTINGNVAVTQGTLDGGVSILNVAGDFNSACSPRGPIVGIGITGSGDSSGVMSPSVIKESDGTYKMWYAGADGLYWRIYYATSPDGTTWNKQGLVLDLGGAGTWDRTGVGRPSVVKEADGTYKMWYSGSDSVHNRIGYATWDGIAGHAWVKQGIVLDLGASGTSYDSYHALPSSVIKEIDGTYKMWYAGSDGSYWRALYATWNGPGNAWSGKGVAVNLGTSAWDASGTYTPFVVEESATSYKMWYAGYGPYTTDGISNQYFWRIGYATSNNGTAWTKYNNDADPVMDVGSRSSNSPRWEWDYGQIYAQSVIKDSDGTYKMWYSGAGINWQLGYATSSDGTTWTRNACNAGGVFAGNAGTVNFTSTTVGQNIGVSGTGALNFKNLTVNKTGKTATLTSGITVSGALTVVAGTLTGSTGTVTMYNGSSISNSDTLTLPGLSIADNATVTTTSSFAVGGALTAGTGATFNPVSPSVITMNDGSSISNSGTLTFSGLSIANYSTVTTASSFAVGGAFAVGTSATFNAGGPSIITMNDGSSISSSGALTFYSLTIPNGAAVTSTGNFAVSSGGIFTVGPTAAATFTPNATGVISGIGTLTGWGTVRVTKTGSALPYDFSNQYLITYKTLANLTVEYIGALAQTVSAVTYGNLKINMSGQTATFGGNTTIGGVLNVAAGTLAGGAPTVTVTMNNGSSISNSGTLTFSGLSIAPSATVTTTSSFAVGGALTVGTGATFSPGGPSVITMNNGSSISNSGTLTFSGLSIAPSATVTTTSSFAVGGALTVGTGATFSPGSPSFITMNNGSTITVSGSGTLTFYNLTIPNAAAVTSTGNFAVASGGGFTVGPSADATFTPGAADIISGAGTLTGYGTVRVTKTGSVSPYDFSSQYTIANKTLSNLTVEYYGANNQMVSGLTYGNLKINVSGLTATLGGAITVGGALNIASGTLNTGTNHAVTLNGSFTNSGTFAANNSNITIGGSDNNAHNIAAFSNGTGTVTFSRTANTATITGVGGVGLTTSGLTVNGAGGTLSLGAGLMHTINGAVTLIAGTLDGGSSTLNLTGNMSGSGAFSASSGTVNYSSTTAAQTVGNYTYNNLTITKGSQTATLAGNITVNNDLAITSGTLDAGANNYVLTVKRNWTNTPGGLSGFNPRNGRVAFSGNGPQTINNANTWYGLTITTTAARAVSFQSTAAQTISAGGSLTLKGAPGQLLTLAPLTAGTPWLLNVSSSAAQAVSYVKVTYSNAGGGAAIVAGTTSSDGPPISTNTNWLFGDYLIVGASGSQTSFMNPNSTNNYVGGAFTLMRNANSVNVTSISVKNAGSVSYGNLSNVKLYYKQESACEASFPTAGFTQFGSPASFNSSNVATFTGTMSVGTSPVCVYMKLDVGAAANNQTIDILINNPSTDVTVSAGAAVPGTAVNISGVTSIAGDHAPTLASGAVSPASGDTRQTYKFTVVYTDADNIAPAADYPKVYIGDADGYFSYTMSPDADAASTLRDGSYTNGEQYKYEVNLGAAADISYYFEAGAATGNTNLISTTPSTGPAVILFSGKNLVGVPKDLGAGMSYSSVLGDDSGSWWCMTLISTGLYSTAYSNCEDSNLVDGKSYWISALAGSYRLDGPAGVGNITTASYDIPLQTGWNLISNPYTELIPLCNVSGPNCLDSGPRVNFVMDGYEYDFGTAVSNAWVSNTIYSFDGASSGYTGYAYNDATPAVIAPWKGYWLFVPATFSSSMNLRVYK